MSIDLRSLTSSLPHAAHVYLRYHYPLFSTPTAPSSAAPSPPTSSTVITTQPTPVTALSSSPTALLSAFHLFEFLLSPQHLQLHFASHPLTATILTAASSAAAPASSDPAVATVRLPLLPLLSAPLHAKPDGGVVRVVDGSYDADGAASGWSGARLRAVMTFEDFGPIQAGAQARVAEDAASKASRAASSDGAVRGAAEYQVAWELEQWRRSEQARLHKEWEEAERRRMSVLESEWKRQTLLREQAYAQRTKDIAALEKRLHSALHELQGREAAIQQQEADLQHRVGLLEDEAKQAREDAALTVQRVKDHQAHATAMSKRIVADLQAQMELLRARLVAEEGRYRVLEEAYARYKGAVAKSSVGELQLKLKEEKSKVRAWEERWEEGVKEREEREERVRRLEAEVGRLKAALEEKEREWIEAEKATVLRLRMDWAQRTRMGGMKRDKEELEDIRRKLRQVQEDEDASSTRERKDPSPSAAAATAGGGGGEADASVNASVNTTIKAPALPTFYEQFQMAGAGGGAGGTSDTSMTMDALSERKDEEKDADATATFHRSIDAASRELHHDDDVKRTHPPYAHPLSADADRLYDHTAPARTLPVRPPPHGTPAHRYEDVSADRGSAYEEKEHGHVQHSPLRSERSFAASRGSDGEVTSPAPSTSPPPPEEDRPPVTVERHTPASRPRPSVPASSGSRPGSVSAAERSRAAERHRRAVAAARRLTAEKEVKETRAEREERERRERRREAWKAESTWARRRSTRLGSASSAVPPSAAAHVRVERVERKADEAAHEAEVDEAMIALMNREEVPKSPSTAPAPHASPARPPRKESQPTVTPLHPVHALGDGRKRLSSVKVSRAV